MAQLPEGVFFFLVVFIVSLCVLWLLLPFAVFGIKDKLNSMIENQERLALAMDKLLEHQAKQEEKLNLIATLIHKSNKPTEN